MADFNTDEARKLFKRQDEEIWECQVEGTIYFEVTNHKGVPKSTSVRGVGSRIRLTTEDRILMQERILDRINDPFVNGMMLRLDADQQGDEATRSTDALSEADLIAAFQLDPGDFSDYVSSLSEVNVRRLNTLKKKAKATVEQAEYIQQLITDRFTVGGDTPTYREMQAAPQ